MSIDNKDVIAVVEGLEATQQLSTIKDMTDKAQRFAYRCASRLEPDCSLLRG